MEKIQLDMKMQYDLLNHVFSSQEDIQKNGGLLGKNESLIDYLIKKHNLGYNEKDLFLVTANVFLFETFYKAPLQNIGYNTFLYEQGSKMYSPDKIELLELVKEHVGAEMSYINQLK